MTAHLRRMHDPLTELCGIVSRHTPGRYQPSVLPRVALYKDGAAPQPVSGVYQPMMALILSGAKEIAIGDRRLRYDPASYFIATVELPASGCVKLDQPNEQYLAVSLDLDSDRLASVLSEADVPSPTAEPAFAVNPVTSELLDAWLRLLRLLDAPQDIAVLAPLCEREILYRLLQGPQGAIVRQIARADSRLSQVRRAIALIRNQFDRPLRVEALAEEANMSPASLHRHFRTATAMSPLQYQKSLRLQEARRLILAGRDVAAAGFAVGYESASQFSREYARLFGSPPSRDAKSTKVVGESNRALAT
ncbi:MAG TPA: AraC family transcriptional regulator [Sphingomicrobium sp.]